jgi:hypothetical protein
MIRCIPKGIFSWNFALEGEGHNASLDFTWLGEQGTITADGTPFDVCKHGIASGHWTLNHEGRHVITAQKASALFRTFEIQDLHQTLVLRAESPFGRRFRIEQTNDIVATIVPDHVLTRRATIETIAQNCDFTTISFSFWLAVLTWRRAARSNSGGSG